MPATAARPAPSVGQLSEDQRKLQQELERQEGAREQQERIDRFKERRRAKKQREQQLQHERQQRLPEGLRRQRQQQLARDLLPPQRPQQPPPQLPQQQLQQPPGPGQVSPAAVPREPPAGLSQPAAGDFGRGLKEGFFNKPSKAAVRVAPPLAARSLVAGEGGEEAVPTLAELLRQLDAEREARK